MKRFLGVLFAVILIASFSQAQLGKRATIDVNKLRVYDSLAVSSKIMGLHQMVRAQAIDTLVVTGSNVDTTQYIQITPVYQLAADTTGGVQFFPHASAYGPCDTIFVNVHTTAVQRAFKYLYTIFKHQ